MHRQNKLIKNKNVESQIRWRTTAKREQNHHLPRALFVSASTHSCLPRFPLLFFHLHSSKNSGTKEMAMNQAAAVKLGLGVLSLCMLGYLLGPPLYWHVMEGVAAVSRSSAACPVCTCDCSSQPLLSIPDGTFSFIQFSWICLDL